MSIDVVADGGSFAMRHRARRAALLAATITKAYEVLGDKAVSAAEVAERLTDEQWEIVAAIAGLTHPPSETTRAMCIGLLSMPNTKGLAI